MTDLWADLPASVQDAALLVGLLLPGLIAGVVVLRGLDPWRLVRAMLRRYLWTNVVFVALIALAVAIGVGLTAQERGLRQGSARAADRFDLIVGAQGSDLTLLLAAVYLRPSDVALVDGARFAEVAAAEGAALVAPIAFGDSYLGAPVIGTTAAFVAHLGGTLEEGRPFANSGEAVAGSRAPVRIDEVITPEHGHGPAADTQAHDGPGYRIVGRMAATGSPWDRAILVPVEGVWQVHGLATGHPPGDSRIGPPFDPAFFPGTPAVLVQAETFSTAYGLQAQFNQGGTMAFFPGTVLAQLHAVMRDVRVAMSVLAAVTQVLVTTAILAALMILIRVFARQLALLRALGAPRRFVLAVVWGYSATLIIMGATAGLGLGWMAASGLSAVVAARTDVAVPATVGWTEVHLVAGFVGLTLMLALIPGLSAIRRPVLTDLRQ